MSKLLGFKKGFELRVSNAFGRACCVVERDRTKQSE
jgi:hypothetical protein